jgi:hypothetical protein
MNRIMISCPNCGLENDFGISKFCHNCGNRLNQEHLIRKSSVDKETSLTSSKAIFQEILENETNDNSVPLLKEADSIYDLGIQLEEVVEQILKKRNFSTQRRLKLKGRSGSLSEIDVLASKKNLKIAVECKNYDRETVVGIKEIRDFHSKLNDIQHYGESLFVTYGKFSSESVSYADKYNIELWDGHQLSQIHLSMLVGRHSPTKNYNEIILGAALPISITFEEVSNILLKNTSFVKVSGLVLFRPYYLFEYKFDSIKIDKRGKPHRNKGEGLRIVDAITEFMLSERELNNSKSKEHLFFSKKEKKDEAIFEDELKNIENNHIYKELTSVVPKIHYKIKENPDYQIKVLEPTLTMKTATYIILEKIIESNIKEESYTIKNSKGEKEEKTITIIPKKSDVLIKKSLLVYVPIWDIEIQSKSMIYRKRVMASSKTVLMDEMALCPKDFSTIKIWGKKKNVHAVCETCGIALCSDHILETNKKYYCKEHLE